MTAYILDGTLMLLLIAAIAYGVKLERKLKALREGQLAFAGAVKELNNAAGRAEQALATLRASGQETDLLHDRIIKARQVKQELETLIARAPKQAQMQAAAQAQAQAAARAAAPVKEEEPLELVSTMALINDENERARRMASLMQRIEQASAAMPAEAPKAPKPTESNSLTGMLQAIAANQAAQQSLNRARRSLDEDLFAA